MCLSELRKSKGIKLAEVAKGLKISFQAVSCYERGTRKFPSKFICQYAEILNEPVDIILKYLREN